MNVNENFGMTDNLYLTKTDTSELTVFNETTNSIMAVTSANDNISIPLTFTQKGIQVLRIDSTANYSFNNYNIFGGTTRHKFDLIKCYIGSSVTSIILCHFKIIITCTKKVNLISIMVKMMGMGRFSVLDEAQT